MRINKYETEGYERLSLSGIKKIVMDLKNPLQLIIGTNGCGKSSLMRALNHLPATPKEWAKGGNERMEISHGNSEYVLETRIKGGAKCSFIRDGVELNEGGTGVVQKQLGEREFGVDADLLALMLGRTKFTTLSASKRRQWFQRLATVDIGYADAVHKHARTALTETTANIKHITNRLARDTDRLLSEEKLESSKATLAVLTGELELMLGAMQQHPTVNTQEIQEANTRATALIAEIQAYVTPIPPVEGNLAELLINNEAEIQGEQAKLEHCLKELDELASQALLCSELTEMDIPVLQARITGLKTSTTAPLKTVEFYTQPITNVSSAQSLVQEAMGGLSEVESISLDRLVPSTPKVPQETLQELSVNTDKKLAVLRQEQEATERTLKNMSCGDHLSCPECNHKWQVGMDKNVFSERELEHTQRNLEIDRVTKERLVCMESLAQYQELETIHQALRQRVAVYPSLYRLVTHVVESKALSLRGWNFVLGLFKTHLSGLQEHLQRLNDCQELETLEHKLHQATSSTVDSGTISGLQSRMSEQIHLSKARITECETMNKKIVEYNKRTDAKLRMFENLDTVTAMIVSGVDSYIEQLRQNHLNTAVNETKKAINELNILIQGNDTVQGILSDLEATREELTIERAASEELVKIMCPVSGIIASQLMRVNHSIVDALNSVISRIWQHDFTVLPCGIDTGELNYKFGVRVQGQSKPADDVADTSEAQTDIINFSFIMVAVGLLKIGEYPLYLDEFGSSFDEAHRANLVVFIKELIANGELSQVFMVNHYSDVHTSLPNADVVVLDEENVSCPDGFNTTVEIVR